jgi:hypothetical protein
MSLKSFHVVFIGLCILLMLVLSGFSLGQYRVTGSGSDLMWGLLALGGAVILLGYGRYFLKKLKNISYL